jgi:PmbA protein
MDEIIERVLDILKKKQVDGYEIYIDQSSLFEVEAKDGEVETLQVSHPRGMAIRILNRQRMGFSYTTSSDPTGFSELEKMISDTIASAEATSPDPAFDFAPAIKNSPPLLPIFDETLERVPEETKIEKARLLEEATRSVDPGRIKKVRKAAYMESLSRKRLINSNGLQFSYRSTLVSVNVMSVAEESGESEVGWDFDYSHFFRDLDVEKVGREAGKKALERLGGKRISTGVYPVLIRNSVASEFLSLLAHSLLAEQVQKGKSALKGKKGEKFFSPLLSIEDDGLHPKGTATFPVDGEGTPSQTTTLVSQGEIVGYLYDRYWANRDKLSVSGSRPESTGNSRRAGIKAPPILEVSNLLIKPGDLPFGSLIDKLQKGLVVEEVMGIHTVDPISGNFSLGCAGDWIEGGTRIHPVKSIAIAGNLFELFKRVICVGEDLRFFGGVGSPSLIVEGLEVSGD